MSQYVIEFGAEDVQSIGAAIQANLAPPYQIEIDSSDYQLSYAVTSRTFRELLNDLAVGNVTSAVIRNNDRRIRYALITGPKIHVPHLDLWMGTIEICVEDWRFVWELLLKQSGLRFVCASAEEGVQLGNEQISPESFPWTASELLLGAIRSKEHPEWIIRDRVLRLPQD